MLRSSKSKASEKDPSSLVVLTATLAVVRRVLDLPDVGNAALLEFKYLLCIAGDSDIAHLVHEFLHAKAADILARAYTMRELDFQTLQDLPLITRQTGANGVYLHYGLPKAIDGPNSLPPNERLIYVGSGTAQAKKDTWKTGQAARVYGGHLVGFYQYF